MLQAAHCCNNIRVWLQELDYYITNVGIDGAITDYPATMSTTLNCKLQDPEGSLEPILLPDACSASRFAPTSK